PLLVRHGRCEVLVQKVRADRKGVKAVGGALKTPLLPSPEPILAHQPGYAPAADGKPIVAKFVHHARAAVGPVRKGEGRADMSQQHHVLALAARTLHRRWTGKSFFAASTKPNLIDFPPWRKKLQPSSESRAPAEESRSRAATASTRPPYPPAAQEAALPDHAP